MHDPRLVGAAVVVLAAAVYLNALANGLVWDDPIILTRQLLAFQSLRDLIFLPRNIPQFSPDYYRPLTIVTYLIDRAVGGASPFMFHFSVVVFHVVTTYLVFRFGVVLLRSIPAAALGAALFAVHPIHSESAAWGAGRSDVLACGFSLAGALVYLSSWRGPWQRATVAAALVFAGTLAKETAVVLLVLVPLSDVLLGRVANLPAAPLTRADRRRQSVAPAESARILSYLPFAAALLLYLSARESVLGSAMGPASTVGPEVVRQLVGAVGHYLGKLVLPVRQSAYISDLPTAPITLVAIVAVIVVLALACLLAWRRGERLVSFLLLWIGVTLAPSLAIVLKIPSAPVAERYLYIPSVGYCLLLAYGAMRLFPVLTTRPARAALGAAIAALLCVGAVATVRRNAVWRSNLTLWEDTAAKNVSNGLPMRSLATTYQQLGDPAKAAKYFQIALQRRNDAAGLLTIYNNLGSLAMMDKRFDDAEQYYRLALASNPQAADALFNLGLIGLTRAKGDDGTHDAAWKRQQAEQARRFFEQAQQLSPLDPDIPVGLGQTLVQLGDPGGARTHFERALQLGLPADTAAAVRELLATLQ